MKYPSTRKKSTFVRNVLCERCGEEVTRTSALQIYCRPCSEIRDQERKRKHHLEKGRAKLETEHALWKDRGYENSKSTRLSLFKSLPKKPNLVWYKRVAIPFSWSGSKNHIFANTARGHVYMREEASFYRAALTEALARNLDMSEIKKNKLWIDIFVQKPNHRGDAANFVDMVCDAIKDATLLDDRWYSIQGVDWQITKHNPMLYVGIGQEFVPDVQVCSTCGSLHEYDMFHKNKNSPNGVGRVCRDCRAPGKQGKPRNRGIGAFG